MRLLLVLAIAAVALGWVIGRRNQVARAAARPAPLPAVPPALRAGAPRTWVIFTTRYCVSCDRVEARVRAAEPDVRVVRVDAEREPLLARSFRVRSAPTTVVADERGVVQARLVGADAVDEYLRARTAS
ncbi:MAG TPA: thioredoxin family protein [Acidimicrobiia bacterium]|nr:thioredoxin family protein [Acidimicrobiia bacterium]